MAFGRRLYAVQERQRARRRSRDLDPAALDAAVEALLSTWPWLAWKYQEAADKGEDVDYPREPLESAIRRYLDHVGL